MFEWTQIDAKPANLWLFQKFEYKGNPFRLTNVKQKGSKAMFYIGFKALWGLNKKRSKDPSEHIKWSGSLLQAV